MALIQIDPDEMLRGLAPQHGFGGGVNYTLVYDGDCRVCVRFVDALRDWDRDREIEIVASQTPGVSARFPWIPPQAYAEAMQLVGPDRATWQGAAAVEKLLDILPRGRLMAWIFNVPFARALADRFYRWFARNRRHMGCGRHCGPRRDVTD